MPDGNELHTYEPRGTAPLGSATDSGDERWALISAFCVTRWLTAISAGNCATGTSDAVSGVHAGPMNGHLGIEKTQLKLQEIAYWKGWSGDVQTYVQWCHVCGSFGKAPRKTGPATESAGL